MFYTEPKRKRRQQCKWIYKELFYDWGSLRVLWNPLTGHILLAWLRKATENRGPVLHLIMVQPRHILTASTRLLITSKSHPAVSILDSLLFLPAHLPDRHIWSAPETSSRWDYIHGSALESMKCSTDGMLSWLKNLIRALVRFFGHKWIPGMFLGEEKKTN